MPRRAIRGSLQRVDIGFAWLAILVPAGVLAKRALDAWTLRQRRERAAGIERLLVELSHADKLEEIGGRLTHALCDVWNARGAALYVSIDDSMVESYLSVFKRIFEETDHIAHYNMMMGESKASAEALETTEATT